jgi:hypothetical protein
MMFAASVIHYVYGGRYRREERYAVKRLSDGEIVETTCAGFRFFSTKKEAEREFDARWHRRMKDAVEHLEAYKVYIRELCKNPPRIRRKKPVLDDGV